MEIKTNFDDWKNELINRFGEKNIIESKCRDGKNIMVFLRAHNKSNILIGKFNTNEQYGYLFDRRNSIRAKYEPIFNDAPKNFGDFKLIDN